HRAPGIPCALSSEGQGSLHSPGVFAPREREVAPWRHCEEHLRRSNPAFLLRGSKAGLLRGACHRAALRADPLARNDVEGMASLLAYPTPPGALQGRVKEAKL